MAGVRRGRRRRGAQVRGAEAGARHGFPRVAATPVRSTFVDWGRDARDVDGARASASTLSGIAVLHHRVSKARTSVQTAGRGGVRTVRRGGVRFGSCRCNGEAGRRWRQGREDASWLGGTGMTCAACEANERVKVALQEALYRAD